MTSFHKSVFNLKMSMLRSISIFILFNTGYKQLIDKTSATKVGVTYKDPAVKMEDLYNADDFKTPNDYYKTNIKVERGLHGSSDIINSNKKISNDNIVENTEDYNKYLFDDDLEELIDLPVKPIRDVKTNKLHGTEQPWTGRRRRGMYSRWIG